MTKHINYICNSNIPCIPCIRNDRYISLCCNYKKEGSFNRKGKDTGAGGDENRINLQNIMKNVKVLFYVPNLLCYMRMYLSFYALFIIQQQQQVINRNQDKYFSSCKLYIILICVAIFTDFLDGYFARCLNQCSNIGIFLDVIADNILRSSLWM